MSRIFLSCDIEGTCGIAHWDETDRSKPDYARFAAQMSREAAAACQGAMAGGATELMVRDAHDSARNLDPALLPREARVLRGWARDPYAMMSGLSKDFDGVIFTGYHSACGWAGNPLSHTMNTRNVSVRVNGEIMSELMMNSLTAALFDVPVLMVTGDRMLCDWFHERLPEAVTVPVSEGLGDGSISIHPELAIERIREGAEKAMAVDRSKCLFPLPERFCVEIRYRQHQDARRASWYPDVKQIDDCTVSYAARRWTDVLTMFHFCL